MPSSADLYSNNDKIPENNASSDTYAHTPQTWGKMMKNGHESSSTHHKTWTDASLCISFLNPGKEAPRDECI